VICSSEFVIFVLFTTSYTTLFVRVQGKHHLPLTTHYSTMPLYNYRAKKYNEQALSEGAVEAETESIAVDLLEERGYSVLFLEEKKSNIFNFDLLVGRVKPKDLVIFSRQLSILISAEVPVVEALKDLASQTKNKKLKKTTASVVQEVEGGVRFSEALSHYPKIFDSFFVNIIKSGEVSGRLQEVLLYLADQMEKDYDLKSKIKGAMIYPIFIVCSLVAIGALMMIFVVPKLTDMLTQTGAELPLATRIIQGISEFLIHDWWLLLLVIIAVVGGLRLFSKSKKGKRAVDNLKLNLPIFGPLLNYIAVIRFARSFRTLLIGGVDIVEGLGIASDMVGNSIYRELLLKTKQNVEGGGALGEEFSKSKLVPQMLSQMLETGEETGMMEAVLEKISEFYTREVNNTIDNLMSLLEPVIMIVLGVAVAVMITAIVLPMYEISNNM